MTALQLFIDHLETPIGRLALVADAHGVLHACGFLEPHEPMERLLDVYARERRLEVSEVRNPSGLTDVLARYFDGDLTAVDAISVPAAGTEFQRTVWRALRDIPCGSTWSYGALASYIGRPKAMRAVGLANGQNPICIVVPCHRVIGSDGSLTGYAGGLERKRWLLQHERVLAEQAQRRLFA